MADESRAVQSPSGNPSPVQQCRCQRGLSDEQYLSARLANTLRHPGIVSWVAALIGEMDTLALGRARYDAYYYVHGAFRVGEPTPTYTSIVTSLARRFRDFLSSWNSRKDEWNSRFAPTILCWRVTCRVAPSTHGWTPPGATVNDSTSRASSGAIPTGTPAPPKDGERTYDFAYNRKTTVRPARMASVSTSGALPPDFQRLGPLDFDVDGVHIHSLHYGTIRDAVV